MKLIKSLKNSPMKNSFILILMINMVLFGCKPEEPTVSANQTLAIIPLPKSIESSSKGLDLKTIDRLVIPEIWSDLQEQFVHFHQETIGPVQVEEQASTNVVRVQKVEGLASEAYKLTINSSDVILEASDYAGAFNALQTWKQMVLNAEDGIVMQVKIDDQPRFGYRGVMIDCSRHFWTVAELKETITQMSFFKLNKLHLHLTDNNAWRVEIKAYPDLITKGTFYKDFPELSDKFYTQDDLKEVVNFAAKHNIEVIPEIDLPGHAIGILAAYPELACTSANKHFEVYPEEMPIADRISQVNMLCLGNPKVYEFAETVVKELVEIFPSKKIHLGGDEVPTNIWETCRKCQKTYKELGLNEWGELQDYFTEQMSAVAKKYNKTMLGWDEINERHAATTEDVVMVWRNYGYPQAIEALERDVPIIMAPQHPCYFDWGYAGNSIRKVYEWHPISDEMDALDKNNLVLGGQACLWTERVPTQDRLEYMLYPRLTALAEVLWSPMEQRNWDGFLQRLENEYPTMETLGINFYKDDAIDAKEFKPSAEKPALVRHAYLTTSLPGFDNYHLEYIFDGRSNTFYWGGRGLAIGDWYQIALGEPVIAGKITIISGDSKDYIEHADVLISEDGTTFSKVATFDEFGIATAELNAKTIQAIRIEVTKPQTAWPIIKEVVIE